MASSRKSDREYDRFYERLNAQLVKLRLTRRFRHLVAADQTKAA